MVAVERQTQLWVLAVGCLAVALAAFGQVVVLGEILSPSGAGDWVLFVVPALGVLGFVGLGTVLTAFVSR